MTIDDRPRLLLGRASQLGELTGAAQGEFRVVEAVLALVEELSARGPLVVGVDDLQWTDPSAILVLHRLGRAVHRLPVMLVCACRPLPRPPELERLVLEPLDDPAVATLVGTLVPSSTSR